MRIGVDVGGTKIEAVILDRGGEVILRKRQPTQRGDYQKIINQITAMVLELESEVDAICSVGLGIPGSVSGVTGLVRNANTTELNGQPFKTDLEAKLGRQVEVANDANCLALSEHADGAARGFNTVFAVIVGTGVGAGVIANGRLLEGANGIAGEWGHNPLPWMTDNESPGKECFCGKTGCIETFLSGPGMEADHFLRTGDRLTAKEISDQARTGQFQAEQTLDLYMDRLARSLAHVCNLIDPEIIVLGGGVSAIPSIYEQVPKQIEQYVFADQFRATILESKHGDSSGVRGAAWLPERQ